MGKDYQIHELANLIPEMSNEEYQVLKTDINEQGLLEPIWLYEDQILDGRHRYRACIETSEEAFFEEYQGDDPIKFVLAENLKRRHLSASQIAAISPAIERAQAKLAKERQRAGGAKGGSDQGSKGVAILPQPSDTGKARDKAAEELGISPRYVSDAKKIEAEDIVAGTNLLADVAAGKKSIPEAKKEIRQRKKAEAVAAIAEQEPSPLDSEGPFAVIYADPPWRYDFAEDKGRSIENNYPTMTLEEIKDLGKSIPIANDSVLYLWATSPKLTEALEVLDAWGFQYVTCAVWDKGKIGMGYYFRQQHELLLVGKCGKLPVPDAEDRPSSVISAPSGKHSAKPHIVYELLEKMYPLVDKVELFARNPRNGWASWGNQA